jgi:hypothetical protein
METLFEYVDARMIPSLLEMLMKQLNARVAQLQSGKMSGRCVVVDPTSAASLKVLLKEVPHDLLGEVVGTAVGRLPSEFQVYVERVEKSGRAQ